MKTKELICCLAFLSSLHTFGQDDKEITNAWGNIDYNGRPWVENISKPNAIKWGLKGRHISLWASHGRYYDATKGTWMWQRPNLFGTTEDLFTQTIVVPYLIPMLENAGATVFTPRERDWQTNEVIVDNDDNSGKNIYSETNNTEPWTNVSGKGFSAHQETYADGENPFEQGTARMAKCTRKKNTSQISYQPHIPTAGKYAVYVSYKTVEHSINDAEYIVYHKGEKTVYRVNQQMGGGTWVYLGSFDFDSGSSAYNRVVLTNNSHARNGMVTGDAVRFGGGMGNIQRGGSTSGLPRCLEGARYYAQWAGAPYSVYGGKGGEDDYADDINTRALMSNWLSGGSVYAPSMEGQCVPIELALAIHSDAGYSTDFKSLIGSLAICTTDFNDGRLNSGISRMTSKDFAAALLDNTVKDLSRKFTNWPKRYLWDKNYSETRLPAVPSAILETVSHQNFPDMLMAQDPNFKFALARSIYKTILRYIAAQHNKPCVVTPLAPTDFSVEFLSKNKVKLSWKPQTDNEEPSAEPESFNVYTAIGNSSFNNGENIHGNSFTAKLEPCVQYNFKITACNKGGESFPTETLSAYYNPNATKTILVVNGFHRLATPAVIETDSTQGFDLNKDIGLSYGLNAGWNGRQLNFDKSRLGTEGGLGYSGDELAGHFVAGNDFNDAATHVNAIAHTLQYNVASSSVAPILSGAVKAENYHCIDLILGAEKYDAHALNHYKTFTPRMQQLLQEYAQHGGAIFVSGAYIGSDMQQQAEQQFLKNVLKVVYTPADTLTANERISGLDLSFHYYNTPNPNHYAVSNPEILSPAANGAFCAMQYSNGTSAAVAYKDTTYRSFVMGIPFECISSGQMQNKIMQGILNFLLKQETINK